MISLSYLYSKFFKKYIRGKAVKNCIIDNSSVIYSGSQVIDSSIGRYSYIGYDCNISNATIGNFCSLASNIIIGADQHPINWVSTSPVFENVKNSGPTKRFSTFDVESPKRTIIESDVWIGHGAIIMGGIKIGHGAIIGAGAIVTKDVESYSIVGGIPAKIIRYRFSEDIRTKLLSSEWWNIDDENLSKIAQHIKNPDTFLSHLNNLRIESLKTK